MAETLQNGLVLASQVARETEVRRSANGVSFATFGETGVPDLDLDRMLEAVPTGIATALKANTYYFVPLALREEPLALREEPQALREPDAVVAADKSAVVAKAYTDEFGDAAICHRNVELGAGHRGVFISTRLMGDRFALSFEFFINVAHAFVDVAGVPAAFGELAWQQALDNVKGETSMDAWESRNLAFGRQPNAEPELVGKRRARAVSPARAFSTATVAAASSESAQPVIDEKERTVFLESAFSDAVAIYLLSLALDFDYSELREREYPLLAPAALAARLKLVAEMFPANEGYEFAVRYRRRA